MASSSRKSSKKNGSLASYVEIGLSYEIAETSRNEMIVALNKELNTYLSKNRYFGFNVDIAKKLSRSINDNEKNYTKQDIILAVFRTFVEAYNNSSKHLAPSLARILKMAIKVDHVDGAEEVDTLVRIMDKWYQNRLMIISLSKELNEAAHKEENSPPIESKSESDEQEHKSPGDKLSTNHLVEHIKMIEDSKSNEPIVSDVIKFRLSENEIKNDVGELKRIFTIKTIPLSKDGQDEFKNLSSFLHKNIPDSSAILLEDGIQFNEATLQSTRKLMLSVIDVLKNNSEWKVFLGEFKNNENQKIFEKEACSAMIFKILADLFMTKIISRDMSEYLRIAASATETKPDADVITTLKNKFRDKQMDFSAPKPINKGFFNQPNSASSSATSSNQQPSRPKSRN